MCPVTREGLSFRPPAAVIAGAAHAGVPGLARAG